MRDLVFSLATSGFFLHLTLAAYLSSSQFSVYIHSFIRRAGKEKDVLFFRKKPQRLVNAVIPWLNPYFLNFHIVLLHLPALDCGIKTPNTSRKNPSGRAELLTCTLQHLRSQPAPFPAGTAFRAQTQAASAADGRSGSSVCVSPTPGPSERGPKVPFPSLETRRIRPLLVTRYMLRTVDIVMPPTAKSTSQCAFLTLII